MAMRCSWCGATQGQFVGGLDPGEWYCKQCAQDVPSLALSPNRSGAVVVARMTRTAGMSGPPPPPELDGFQRVVPVGERIDRSGLVVTMFSAELFEDGFRMRSRIELTPDHPHWEA